jgi:hypothetical protein
LKSSRIRIETVGKREHAPVRAITLFVLVALATALPSTTFGGGCPQPTFSPATVFPVGDFPIDLATGDLNGDGRLDLTVVNLESTFVSVLLNTTAPGASTPAFAPAASITTGDRPTGVAIGDINGDGRSDLAVSNYGGSDVAVLLNSTPPGAAMPTFAAPASYFVDGRPDSVELADINSDGRLDLVLSNPMINQVLVLINQTAPGAAAPAFGLPVVVTVGTYPTTAAPTDLNGDGRPDIVVTNFSSGDLSILINTTPPGSATPSFTTPTAVAGFTNPIAVAPADFNGDGRPDLGIVDQNVGEVTVLINGTSPGSTTPTFVHSPSVVLGDLIVEAAASDVNGDGRADVVVPVFTSSVIAVLINSTAPGAATASFAMPVEVPTSQTPGGISLGDFNGDGAADLATTDSGIDLVAVHLNTCAVACTTMEFSSPTAFAAEDEPLAIATSDFNGDGLEDCVVANGVADTVSIFLSTTAPGAAVPSFSPGVSFAAGDEPASIVPVDINLDGRADLATVNFQSDKISVLMNLTAPGATSPTFDALVELPVGNAPTEIAAADLNGDGRADLVSADFGADTLTVFLNATPPGSASPVFASGVTIASPGAPEAVAATDVNGDGRLDLVTADVSTDTAGVRLNLTTPGSMTPLFGPPTSFAVGNVPASIAAADINGDGRPDLATTSLSDGLVSVLVNTTAPGAATPSFAPSAGLSCPVSQYFVRTCDLNNDGKADLMSTNEKAAGIWVLVNMTPPGSAIPVFAPGQFVSAGGAERAFACTDFNGDGRADIVGVNRAVDTVSVILNNSCAACELVCPDNIAVDASAQQGTEIGAIVNYQLPVATGSCSGAPVTCAPAPGSFFPVGTTTVACATSAAGLGTPSCSFTVTVRSAFSLCVADDASGDVISIVADRASPLYRLWQLRVASTGQVLEGRAERLVFTPGRSLVASDHDSRLVRMDLTVNFGARTATATVVDLVSGRRFIIRDRNIANDPPCS